MQDRERHPPHEAAPLRHADDRLDSWKALAAYLGRGVTTVQRWEQEEHLPVYRLPHAKKGSVFAFKSDLEAWRAAREQSPLPRANVHSEASVPMPPASLGPTRPESQRKFLLGTVTVVAVLLAALGLMRAWKEAPATGGGVTAMAVPRPIANDVSNESSPSLSPAGDEVVYRWARQGAWGLYVKSIKEGPPRPLLTVDERRLVGPNYPKWSPKGDLIAFLQHEDPNNLDSRTLYVISPSGGAPRRLTTISGTGLAWHPEGHMIAFVDRTAASQPKSIHVISLGSGERRQLTSPPPGSYGDLWCAFSPDGRRLAIARYATIYEADVYVTNVGEGRSEGVARLTSEGWPIDGLDWTPDGQSIVFGSPRGLWKVSATRGHSRVLVAGAEAAVWHPSFSRATAGGPVRLAYQYELRDVNIWRWSASPTGPGTLSKVVGSTWWDDHPAFSPDGRRVAFASNRTGVNEIWTANVDGSAERQVTFEIGAQVIWPQWSPDGERLAFSASAGGNRDIYVIRTDGSKLSRMTYEPSEEGNPSWSRDGRWIYFRSDRAGGGQIWKMPIDGGPAVRVTEGAASQGFESADGTVLYFVRSMDVRGLWSVPAGGGKETFVVGEVREGMWGVAKDGIHFLVPAPEPASRRHLIRLYDFGSKTVSSVATLLPDEASPRKGFSVSADGQSVLWCQMDSSISDLMLIDSWPP